jgi:predicted GNAT family acetyltransferase
MIYELVAVQPAAPCAGQMRLAVASDEALLVEWFRAFHEEVDIDAFGDMATLFRVKSQAGQLFVWETVGAVSMAGWAGKTADGVRIVYVYTPPGERGKGFASALVAALSQRLLDEGSPRCFLYTNAANPTSNKIYRSIGYSHVCDVSFYDFHAPAG